MSARVAANRRDVLAPAFVLFAIMVAHTTLETARDALFLTRVGPDQLAWVYLTMAATALGTFALVRRWTGLRDPRALLLVFLAGATLGTTVFAAEIARSRSVVFAFYVWTGLAVTLIVPSFWTLLDRSLRVGDAKRAFATIGAGGVGGAIVGSALAASLGRVMPATSLVAVGALAYAVATACAWTLAPRRVLTEPRPRTGRAETLSRSAHRYVALLIGLGLVATVALTLGDLLFKRVVAQTLAPGQLVTAFGVIYASFNAIGLVVQLVITPRLLAKWGVGVALAILPAILATTGFGYVLTGVVAAVVALELADGGLRHSLHVVGSELLYLPIPTAIRDAWKPVADAIALRGGEAVAALIAFGIGFSGSDTRAFATICAAVAVLWLIGAQLARRAYVEEFRATLHAGEIERNASMPTLDGDAVELLREALASPDEHEALAALDLLAGRARIPALVLYHPSAAVVQRALGLLKRDPGLETERAVRHLLDHADVEIRAAALAATSTATAFRGRRIAALADSDPRIRTAALVGLVGDPEYGDTAAAEIAEMVTRSTGDRATLARTIAHASDRGLRHVLYELLTWHEPDVIREAVRVLARDPADVDLGRLLGLLAQPHVRGDVRRVFLAAGARGLDRLLAALEDPRTPLPVHQHLPRTISRFGSRRAAAALVARLPRERDATTVHKILRALGRMRSADPELRIDERAIRAYARHALGEAARYATLADALAVFGGSPLLVELLGEEADEALEHVFRALGILQPRAGLRTVHDALVSADDARRSAAREVLEAWAPLDIRGPLLVLVDVTAPEQRRARLGALAAGPFASAEALIASLLADPSESVRCFAAYQAAERGLVALRPEIARLRASADPPLVTSAFDQAIARLDAGA